MSNVVTGGRRQEGSPKGSGASQSVRRWWLLLYRDETSDWRIGYRLLLSAGPGDAEFVDAVGLAEADGYGEFDLGEVASGGHDLAGDVGAVQVEFDEGGCGDRVLRKQDVEAFSERLAFHKATPMD